MIELGSNPSIPFYLMPNARESCSGMPPVNTQKQIAGFREAIKATKKRISDYKIDGADVSDLELHLKSLERQLEEVINSRGFNV